MERFKIESKKLKKIVMIFFSIVICCLAALGTDKIYSGFLLKTNHSLSYERLAIFFFAIYFIFLHFVFEIKLIYDFIYKKRFLLAIALFLMCLIFQFHGSSIGMWNYFIASSENANSHQNAILGLPRGIRSDEWNVFTPLSLSQNFNNYGITNAIAQASPTDMLTVYNQPVYDITAIAKPFFFGYLLFGSSIGLSWFWMGRLIALFVVTFEMFMLITKKNKIYSVTAAFLITFSSLLQWWFAVNFLVEMLFAGQLAVLMVYHFLNTDKTSRKIIFSVVFTICGLAYIFALYPAWMVPLAYLFAVLAIWVLFENLKNIKHHWSDLLYLLSSFLVIVGISTLWYLRSKNAFELMLNTVYPGKRTYTGGGGLNYLFYYVNNLLTPYKLTNNPCESAMLYGFFPFTEILAIIYIIKNKLKDSLVWLLTALDLFFISFAVFGFPEIFSKITLLSYTTQRIIPIICLIEIFIYLRILSNSDKSLLKSIPLRLLFVGALSCFSVWFVFTAKDKIPIDLNPSSGLPIYYLVCFAILITGFVVYFFLPRFKLFKVIFAIGLVSLSILTGFHVNPLMRTTDAIYKKPLSTAINRLQKTDPGTWISTDLYSNFLIANGAPTINSTNILPVLDRWKLFDKENKYTQIYNRYAHIQVFFTEEKTVLEEAVSPDSFILNLNLNDLKTLKVKYICTNKQNNLPIANFKGTLDLVYEDALTKIFLVSYK